MTLEEAKRKLERLHKAKHFACVRTNVSIYKYEADGIAKALQIIEKVDTEPVVNSDTLTLTGLAYELGKLFHFKYLTLDSEDCLIWDKEPFYAHSEEWVSFEGGFFVVPVSIIKRTLDLSEYEDESGKVDYSKCIVDLSEYKED